MLRTTLPAAILLRSIITITTRRTFAFLTFTPRAPHVTRCLIPSLDLISATACSNTRSRQLSFLINGVSSPSSHRRMTTTTTDNDNETTVVSTCREKIMVALETDDVTVTGAYDDPNGSHISITVTSKLFEGKRPVQRQQMVYKAIWEEMQGAVHAVDSMVCKSPEEA